MAEKLQYIIVGFIGNTGNFMDLKNSGFQFGHHTNNCDAFCALQLFNF